MSGIALTDFVYVSGGAGPIVVGSPIVWNPTVANGPKSVGTWADVVVALTACGGECDVYLQGTSADTFLVTSTFDCLGRTRFIGSTTKIGTGPTLTFTAGASIKNPKSFNGVFTSGVHTVSPAIIIDIANSIFSVSDTGQIAALAGSILSPISVQANLCEIKLYGAVGITNAQAGVAAIDYGANTGVLTITERLGQGPMATNMAAGSGTLFLVPDASVTRATQTLHTGSVSLALGVVDASQNLVWHGGATGARPSGALFVSVGQPYFDTTLGIPVWWNGTAWVNASGAAV